jgi:hypothetical protein
MKTCSKCDIEKEIEQFRIRNKSTGLRRNECVECLRKKHKKWRDSNPGVNRRYYDKQYEKTRFQFCRHCEERYRLYNSGGYCSKKCYILGKIEKQENGCWEWLGAINVLGYGKASIYDKEILAHRLSYEIFVGKIPTGLILRHTCDNRKCINPVHLIPGTYKENTRDMIDKGRANWLKERKI